MNDIIEKYGLSLFNKIGKQRTKELIQFITETKPELDFNKIIYIFDLIYFNDLNEYTDIIIKSYENKLSDIEKFNLIFYIYDQRKLEKFILNNYSELKKIIKNKFLCLVPEIDYKVYKNFDDSADNSLIYNVPNWNPIFLLYKYFYVDIRIFENQKIVKFSRYYIERLSKEELFKLALLIMKNNDIHNKEFINILISLPEFKELSSCDPSLQEIKKSILGSKIHISFYNNRLTSLYKSIKIDDLVLSRIDSIYSKEYIKEVRKLSVQNNDINKKSYEYLKCFKLFLKEFVEQFKDSISVEEIKILDALFKRTLKRGCFYSLLAVDNLKSLYHLYKTDEFVSKFEVSLDIIKNNNAKKYLKLINNYLKNTCLCNIEAEEINLLLRMSNILGYELIEKLSKILLDNQIISYLKDKSDSYFYKLKTMLENANISDFNFPFYSYLVIFDRLLEENCNKITLEKINKVLVSFDYLLVPYNYHIKNNLNKLELINKGDILLEKMEGIKLYEEYRKRIFSTIPNYQNVYCDLKYGFVDLHDENIISNGVEKYLLPNKKSGSSCLTPNGKAKSCLVHGSTNCNGRFFEVTLDNMIVAYSWVWRCGDILCFDNIEITEKSKQIRNFDKKIYEIYYNTANVIQKITNKEDRGGIKLVLIGRNKMDIRNEYIDKLPSLKKYTNKMFKPNTNAEIYLKDSQENQLILSGKYSNNLNITDVEPIYMYQRKDIIKFSDLNSSILNYRINAIFFNYCQQNTIKYDKIEENYIDGYLGDDWFVGFKKNNSYDFYYYDNDKRLFDEAKKIIHLEDYKNKIPLVNSENEKIVKNILYENNLKINYEKIREYFDQLNENNFIIDSNSFSHSTINLETLSSIFKEKSINSVVAGNWKSKFELCSGSNGIYYVCVAKVGTKLYDTYKKTGTIILNDELPCIKTLNTLNVNIPIDSLFNTSYPFRGSILDDEYQIYNKIPLKYAKAILGFKTDINDIVKIIYLEDMFGIDIPIVLEDSNSKIDKKIIKKYTNLKL